jgi:acyl-CoA thioester hydrolase
MSEATSEFRLRVRYAETDRMGFAYYGCYAAWLEVGRVEFLRERGMVYRDVEDLGKLLAVRHLSVDYLAPARYDDLLVVRTRTAAVGKSRVDFESEIVRESDGQTVARGRVRLACLDREGRPQRLGEELTRACAPSS